MTAPGSDYPANWPPVPAGRGAISRQRLLVVLAALLLGAAAIAIAVIVVPKGWQVATGPSRQAGREFAAHWMQSRPAADVVTAFDIDMRCLAAADHAATQGVELANGSQLAPGRVMRAEFRNACIDEARQRAGQRQ